MHENEQKVMTNLNKIPFGSLYVVSTPIGNLADITERAKQTLREASRILAEDTRRTQQLLSQYGISTKLVSLHEHNEKARLEQVLQWLEQGDSLALVSDAGTPLINDPGYLLVRHLREAGHQVVPIPGACALITALSVAGMPTDRFCFEGFLPAKSSARKKTLQALALEQRTLIFYESSHRIVSTLQDMLDIYGEDRPLVIAREMTKRFETFLSGRLNNILEQIQTDTDQQKGEFVIILKGAEIEEQPYPRVSPEQVMTLLLPHLSTKTAAQITSQLCHIPGREAYDLALSLKESLKT